MVRDGLDSGEEKLVTAQEQEQAEEDHPDTLGLMQTKDSLFSHAHLEFEPFCVL